MNVEIMCSLCVCVVLSVCVQWLDVIITTMTSLRHQQIVHCRWRHQQLRWRPEWPDARAILQLLAFGSKTIIVIANYFNKFTKMRINNYFAKSLSRDALSQ